MNLLHQLYIWLGIQKGLNAAKKVVPNCLNGLQVAGKHVAGAMLYDFSEDGAGTYTATSIVIPAGRSALVLLVPVTAWNSGTSATLTLAGNQTANLKTQSTEKWWLYAAASSPLTLAVVAVGTTTAGQTCVVVLFLDADSLETVEKAA